MRRITQSCSGDGSSTVKLVTETKEKEDSKSMIFCSNLIISKVRRERESIALVGRVEYTPTIMLASKQLIQ